jgi:hypothetical protein
MYELAPADQTFTLAGGPGSCEVRTAADCRWSARASDDWITITSGQSGRGNGTITFLVLATVSSRNGRVTVAEGGESRCDIRQTGVLVAEPSASLRAWTSRLDVPGASGQVLLDGMLVAVVPAGRPHTGRIAQAGRHRVEAVLTRAAPKGGTWRFEIAGLQAGSLEVSAGTPAAVGPSTVAFRLEGRAGERLSFSFVAR